MKLLYVKLLCVKFVCVLSLCVCVKFVCVKLLYVCVREAAGGGEGVPEEPGIQNQKQEPNTKMSTSPQCPLFTSIT